MHQPHLRRRKLFAGGKAPLITSLGSLEVRRQSQRAPGSTQGVSMPLILQNKPGGANQGATSGEDGDLCVETGFMTVQGQNKKNKVAALCAAKE